MKSGYTKLNLEKSKESISREAERTIVREHLRTYKDDVANFSNSASIYDIIVYDDLEANRNIFEKLFGKNLIVSLSDPRWQQLDKIVLSPGIPRSARPRAPPARGTTCLRGSRRSSRTPRPG